MSNANGLQGTNIVGVHYRVGKKIGEGSFGVIFEGEHRCLGGVNTVCSDSNLVLLTQEPIY